MEFCRRVRQLPLTVLACIVLTSAVLASGPSRAVELSLQGQREEAYRFAPVYRRFNTMIIELSRLPEGSADQLELVVTPDVDGAPARRVPLNRLPRIETTVPDQVLLEVPIRGTDGPTPVGGYRLSAVDAATGQELAGQRFYVIYNAYHREDEDAYHPRAEHYLADLLPIMQQSEGRPYVYRWTLGVHDQRVFLLALDALLDHGGGPDAIQALGRVAADQFEGYWPTLRQQHVQRAVAIQDDDPDWEPASVRCIPARLSGADRRAQCFDFAALHVALLRSVGLPATAVTVMGPNVMASPYDLEQSIQWAFHVWTELHYRGQWWASDTSYLNWLDRWPSWAAARPDLQPPWGPWFSRLLGPDSRVWRQRDWRAADATPDYQKALAR